MDLNRAAMVKSGDAFAEMALDCFEPDPDAKPVPKFVVHNVFERWCDQNKRKDLFRSVAKNQMGKSPSRCPRV
jgi:hypothetical protein